MPEPTKQQAWIISNAIPRRQRIYFIRPLRHHIFGMDFADRDSMGDDEAVSRFDEVWNTHIKPKVETAELIGHTEALGLIPKNGQNYCVEQGNFHCRFRLDDSVFIAQVSKTGHKHNQLWAVSAQNYDTRTVFATFEHQHERDRWNDLSKRLRITPEDLARRVLTAYLRSFHDI